MRIFRVEQILFALCVSGMLSAPSQAQAPTPAQGGIPVQSAGPADNRVGAPADTRTAAPVDGRTGASADDHTSTAAMMAAKVPSAPPTSTDLTNYVLGPEDNI